MEQKLGHVYAALESGSVDIDDLAPRLKKLRARQRELDEKKDEALDEMNQRGDSLLNPTAFRRPPRRPEGDATERILP